MTSSILAGERKWASSRRGGMTVLGKVAVPKPINLPSQKLENHGLDPNVEIVPKGSLSWGSRPSSSTSNPWGSAAASPNADCNTTVSPHHPSNRPTSGSGLSRPSTAGSDRHDPSSTTWGPNSRPSSASGVLTSNQSTLTSSRPLSSETRPGSAHLSRFAEPVYDHSVAWGPNGTADRLSIPSKGNDFSLSSGDFPTLGSEKDNTPNSSEPHDHVSHGRPESGSGRIASVKNRNEMSQTDHKSGTVDTWSRDASSHYDDMAHPNADKWHGDAHHYPNPNVPPHHYDTWQGPPMSAPPSSVWYRPPPPPPPGGPPYPHVPHGGFPMEPYPYYRPQIPPPLPNSQTGPPPGPGPRGPHPRNGDFYRPQMPDAFIRPGMPMRPGFYPGPVPYDGYYGPPPMGYNNPNDREMPYMGIPHGPPGPHGPPVYNVCPPQNPSEHNDPHFRGGPRGPGGNMFVHEQSDSLPPEESRGPYKVLKKHEKETDADMEEDNWEQNLEKVDHHRPTFHKVERVTDTKRNEDTRSRLTNQGYPSGPVIAQGPHKCKGSKESWANRSCFPEDTKDSTLIQKIEDLNAKVRASDIRGGADQTNNNNNNNKSLINPKGTSTIAFGSISITGDIAHPYDNSRQAHRGVINRADYHSKGILGNQDTDGWRKKQPFLGSEVVTPEIHNSVETKDTGESLTQMVDPADGQAQRDRMREMAKQRAIELQKEEEERIREQKAKANAKLEELNRRTLASANGTTHIAEKNTISSSVQEYVDRSQQPTEPAIDKISENSQPDPVDQSILSKQSDGFKKPVLANDGGVSRQKRVGQRQKQSVQVVESSVDKSTLSVTGEAVESQESTLPNNSNTLPESTQHKKRNNKISKNKHKLDDADTVKQESSDTNPTIALETDNKDVKQANLDQITSLPSNQHKAPQQSRRMPRNSQANRFHVGDVAVWAPVRAQTKDQAQNKEEPVQDDVAVPEKTINFGQTNMKNKRAEMERYVPKPVAKELAQQGSIIQPEVTSLPKKMITESMTDVGPTLEGKSGKNKKVVNKFTNQHEESTPVVHEWDPSDGWFMPDEYPPVETTPVVKDEGAITGKGKRPAYKGQRSTVKNNQIESSTEVEVGQTDRPASSKENRSSHWQPKSHPYKGGYSSGGQNVNSEVKRESRKYPQRVQPDEPVHDMHQEGQRERKPASFRAQAHGNIEDEAQAQYEHHHQHHVSSGFRKHVGQNNRSTGQDDKRRHNYQQQQHNANINREKPRQNLHYEYQPVGSNNNNNNNNNNKSNHVGTAAADAGPRYKERGSGQSRRGGGNFYGRQ